MKKVIASYIFENKLHKGLLWFAECFCVTQAKDIGDLRLQFAQYDPVLQVSLRMVRSWTITPIPERSGAETPEELP